MVKCQKCGKEVATVSSLGNCVLCMSPNAKFYSPDGKELIQAEIKKKEVNNMSGNENEQLQEKLEEQTEKANLYEEQLRLIALKKIEEKIVELKIPESEADYFRQNPSALKGYSLGLSNQKDSGKGSLSMTPDMIRKENSSENDKKEFDSIEEMLEWTRKNDKEAYEAIKAKTYRGLTENKNFWEWKDSFDKDGKSIIGRTIQKMNEDARRKLGFKGDKE